MSDPAPLFAPRPPARPELTLGQDLLNQFSDLERYGTTLLVLLLAVSLGALLGYHPASRRKVTSRAALEQPKAVLLYALVGALVGHIVTLNELMALVVFGIGGLMRFRTDTGEAKDTGRVILATIVGICCGMNSYLIAVLASAFGWILIWYLERQVIGRVEILGLDTAHMPLASKAYAGLLRAVGCKVVGEVRNPKRASLELTFTSPRRLDEHALRENAESLPEQLRGVAAWELS